MFYCEQVPLSDREKRLLDEMEAALLTEDPRLVSALSASPNSPSKNRVLTGVALLLLGLATLLGGVIAQVAPVGILGFLIALTGVVSVISAYSAGSNPKLRGPKSSKSRSKLSDRMEKRWEDRNNQ